jgi:catechol 2,3-dioxygenase-like lactoylglutathione lyase family enzyme
MATMTSVSLGENSKFTANPSERDRIRKFYRDVLGCPATRESERIDIFRIGTSFYLGVVYDDSALSAADSLKSIWLDLRTDRPEEVKKKILDFGIQGIEFWDREHFYFQAPGGQVFRLVGANEEMSKWQR